MQQRAEPSLFLLFQKDKKKITKTNRTPWPPSVITLVSLTSSYFPFFASLVVLMQLIVEPTVVAILGVQLWN